MTKERLIQWLRERHQKPGCHVGPVMKALRGNGESVSAREMHGADAMSAAMRRLGVVR